MGLSGVAHGEDSSGLPARAICRKYRGVGYPWSARRTAANQVSLEGMPGVGLTSGAPGQARSERLALEPYWGKPDVRHLRGGGGNVGIIRSPVRATALPDPGELSVHPSSYRGGKEGNRFAEIVRAHV